MSNEIQQRPRVRKILVARNQLTSIGLFPSSFELYDMMHVTTCAKAIELWEEEWSFCPVCLARYEADGSIRHDLRRDLFV